MITYDRAVLKFDAETVAAETPKLYGALPLARTVSPTKDLSDEYWRLDGH